MPTNRDEERTEEELNAARDLLISSGYVVLKEKSYRQAQERQRVAEALRESAERRIESTERWARDCCEQERRVRDRLVFVYGVAQQHGATTGDLAGEWVSAR